MGQHKGHAPCAGAGRPAGAKNKTATRKPAEEIREAITQLVGDNRDDILNRLYKQLMTLEGYAYISGLSIILKQIMPTLQSITLENNTDGDKSPLLLRIENLKNLTKNK